MQYISNIMDDITYSTTENLTVTASETKPHPFTKDEAYRLKTFANTSYYDLPYLWQLKDENRMLREELQKLKEDFDVFKYECENKSVRTISDIENLIRDMSATYIANNVSV